MSQYTQEQLDALVASISIGARRVKYRDRDVEYHSLSDMLALKRAMEVDLGLSSGGLGLSYVQVSKGLDPSPGRDPRSCS